MFKRINKRFRKKEKEEAAGLNDEMKEILGMQDTDSDESDSSSNSEHSSSEDLDSSDSDGESQSAETSHAQIAGGLKRQLESDDEEDAGSEADESEQEVNEDAEDGGTVAPMTVVEALSEPLYPVGLSSDARACILCPGKELKHAKMVSVHVASSTHLRRAKRFAALASRVGEEEEDPRLLVAALDESVRVAPSAKSMPKPTRPQKSKRDRRLEKRQRRQERRATKTSASMSPVAKDAQTKRLRSPALSPARLSNPDFQSPADKVLRQKFTRKQTDAVKKHKRDNPRKSSQLHKTARSRRLDV